MNTKEMFKAMQVGQLVEDSVAIDPIFSLHRTKDSSVRCLQIQRGRTCIASLFQRIKNSCFRCGTSNRIYIFFLYRLFLLEK